MAKIKYLRHAFKKTSLDLIEHSNKVADSYQAQGYLLTLRQLYYRLVAAGIIPNDQNSYNALGKVINNARYAGMLDWDAFEDRTRSFASIAHYDSPVERIAAAAAGYRIDKWQGQKIIPEIWVEKEALAGVVEPVASINDVGFFCCRGYVSATAMHDAAARFIRRHKAGQTTRIIYLGDHDPSGLHMPEDVAGRITLFMEHHLPGSAASLDRIALTMEQIEEYKPPPNPAKENDSRFLGYQELHGNDSWELDALEPSVLHELIDSKIQTCKDKGIYELHERHEARERAELEVFAAQYESMKGGLNKKQLDAAIKRNLAPK